MIRKPAGFIIWSVPSDPTIFTHSGSESMMACSRRSRSERSAVWLPGSRKRSGVINLASVPDVLRANHRKNYVRWHQMRHKQTLWSATRLLLVRLNVCACKFHEVRRFAETNRFRFFLGLFEGEAVAHHTPNHPEGADA